MFIFEYNIFHLPKCSVSFPWIQRRLHVDCPDYTKPYSSYRVHLLHERRSKYIWNMGYLPVCIPVCLSTCLSIYFPACLLTCPPAYLPAFLGVFFISIQLYLHISRRYVFPLWTLTSLVLVFRKWTTENGPKSVSKSRPGSPMPYRWRSSFWHRCYHGTPTTSTPIRCVNVKQC